MVQDSTMEVVMDTAQQFTESMEYTSTSYEMTSSGEEGLMAMILAMGAGILIFVVLFAVFMIIVQWKIYTKAGQPGWAQFIPIYGQLVFLRIIGRPWWWLLLCILVIPAIILMFMIPFDMAKSFGKSSGFGVGLLLLPIVFYPMLAFGSATYVGPGGVPKAA